MTKDFKGRKNFGSYNSDDSDRPRWDAKTKHLADYEYRDIDRRILFRIQKGINQCGEKCFRTQRLNRLPFGGRFEPDEMDDWLRGLGDTKKVPYRLPELLGAPADSLVFICEGEKDVDTLAALGLIATTNPFGALKWMDEYSTYLINRDVVILPDNDERGQEHAALVFGSIHPKARSVRIVNLPGLKEAGDVSDWLRAGHTKEELLELVCQTQSAPVPAAPSFSEEAMALEFAERHSAFLRYVPPWGQWMQWTGTHWRKDDMLLAYDLARPIVRDYAMRVSRGGDKLASAKTVAAVSRLAQSDRKIVAAMDQWDADPWLLNTPDGIIDLRTGAMRPACPEEYVTKITAVSPGGNYPTWRAHLKKVTGGDRELESFLKRIFGYALTGSTQEHALFFFYGGGGNGKGVTLETVASILSGYQRTAPVETFTETRGERHPTELAMLMGARLVTAQETEEGRRWAESRLKSLTGGDKISARFMQKDFFEFTPQFKLFIAGNHKPGLRNVDEAIRRRLHLVPFTVTIPREERDPRLKDKLKDEWSGILAWMIEGCLEWKRDGLKPPAVVTQATDEYLADEDVSSNWMEECCEKSCDGWEAVADLYASFDSWAKASNEFVMTKRRFSQKLSDLGFVPIREGKDRTHGFGGLKLKPKPM
jgi:putative DNA primase/helicase